MAGPRSNESPPSFEAPRESGQRLLAPPPETWDDLWTRPPACDSAVAEALGVPPRAARRELLEAALAHTRNYRDVAPSSAAATRVVMTGHQPELFHPGVWFKNFLVAGLAERWQAAAVHVIIDNDVCRNRSIRIPVRSPDGNSARAVAIPFDRLRRIAPFEEARLTDAGLFASFGRRAAEAIGPLVPQPLASDVWPTAVDEVRRTGNVAWALAAARHACEGRWGLESLELPLSAACRTRGYSAFAAAIVERIEAFVREHNQALAEHRAAHRVRSAARPVPDLEQWGEWFEAPFWVWTADDPQRRRLYVRPASGRLELTDRNQWRGVVEGPQLAEWMAAEMERGIKIRPRALTTTMWLRMLQGDCFLHGLGGVIYDRITDVLFRRFWQLEPTPFLMATATLRLPVPLAGGDPRRAAAWQREARDCRYHPERLLPRDDPRIQRAIDEKRRWIADGDPRRRRARHAAIAALNRELAAPLETRRAAVLQALETFRRDRQRDRVLGARDYAWPLFPASLGDDLQALARATLAEADGARTR